MKIKKSKPITNGQRHQINIQKKLLAKYGDLHKQSIFGLKRFFGRSSICGRITIRHKGSGCKKKVRFIDFSNQSKNSLVLFIMYDSFRTAFTSLNFDLNRKIFFRLLAIQNVNAGCLNICSKIIISLKLGNRMPLINIPAGSILHNLSLLHKSKYVRSAGSFFQIIQKNYKFCQIRLPSGCIKKVSTNSFGTLGSASNPQHNLIYLGKAGRCRNMGIRPSVRGIAMNPVDHPHGGKSNKGCVPVTPWGALAKNKPTV
jgi:large subunit ribosomal protein L2